MADRSALLNTPEEILVKIIEYLPPEDQVVASRTCRALKACTDISRLRYERELALAGYIDIPNATDRNGTANSHESTTRAAHGERSPHTGRIRSSIRSVQLAPWPRKPPATRQDISGLTASEKTELLGKREAAWDTLTPRQVRMFTTTGAAGVYELQEGIHLICDGQEFDVWGSRPEGIRLIPLPSATDPDLDEPIVPCKEVSMDYEIADLTMDPTQDLIVVAEHRPDPRSNHAPAPLFKYHLLTLSTFKPHPMAQIPILDFPPTNAAYPLAQQLIQVMGDTMVVLAAVTDLATGDQALAYEEMVAWNWKTGDVLGRVRLGRTLARCTMAMLSPTTVAVAMTGTTSYQSQNIPHLGAAGILGHPERVSGRPSIDIYSFAQQGQVQVHQPLARYEDDSDTPRGHLLASLLLPSITGKLVHHFHMRPDPAFPASRGGLGQKPFGLDPRAGVIVIELTLDEYIPFQPIPIGVAEKYEIFMLREFLVDLAAEGEESLRESWTGDVAFMPCDIDWQDWGEEHTRFTDPSMRRRLWVCSCSGYRYASLEQFRNAGGVVQNTHVTVHDFNPYSIARERVAMKRALEHVELEEAEETLNGRPGEGGDETMNRDHADPDDGGARERDSDFAGARAWQEDGDYTRRVRAPLPPEAEGHCGDECEIELITEPTIIDPLDSSFDIPVISRLPYRTVTRRATCNPTGIMIEDQRLLLISQSPTTDFGDQVAEVTVWCF